MTSSADESDFDSLSSVWLEAFQYFQQRDYKTALRLYDELDAKLGDWATQDEMRAAWLGLVASQAFAAAYETGRFERALYYANRDGAALRSDEPIYARALNNQGLALLELGRLLEAEARFQAALAVLDKVKADDIIAMGFTARQLRTLTQRHLSILSDTRQETKESLTELAGQPLFTAPDDVGSSFAGGADQTAVDILNRAAFAAQRAGRRRDFQQAVEICATALAKLRSRTKDAKVLGIALSNLGQFSLFAGQAAEAVKHLTESVEFLARTARPSEPLARALHNLSEAYLKQGQQAEALDQSRQAWLEIKEAAPDTPQALQILHQLAKLRILTEDLTRARAALVHAMKIYDANRGRLADSEAGHEGVFNVYRALVELMLIIAVHQQWPDEAMTLVENAKARFWNEHLERLLAQQAGPKQAEASAYPDMALPADVQWAGDNKVVQINDQITDPGCMLINFFTGPNYTFVISYFEGQHQAKRVHLTETELQTKVESFLKDIRSSSRRELWRESGGRLAAQLLGRIIQTKRKVRQIQLLPDGPLWYLPFDYLPLPVDGAEPGADTRIFMVAPTAHIPSAKLLARYRPESLTSEADQPREILIIARSSFASALNNLVSVETEVEAVAGLAQAHHCQLLKDRAATKSAVLAQLAAADVIHVATHALAHAQDARAAVVLSDGAGGDDMLWAGEIAQLSLRAQVVFLSACSSAVGRLSVGEGLMSVARAFLLAGCQSVIASLWPVVDKEAPRFVRLFYQELFAGQPPAEALQLAKQKAITARLSNHIVAAFQIYGGVTRPLNLSAWAQLLTARQEDEA